MNSKVVSEQYTYVAIFNMMQDVSTQKSLTIAEYTLYSAVDKDLDKERSYDPLPGYYQITNRLYTGCFYVAVCSRCVNVCLHVCMHMGTYVCVHVYAFMIVHVT